MAGSSPGARICSFHDIQQLGREATAKPVPDSSDLHKHITLQQLLELADPPLKLEDPVALKLACRLLGMARNGLPRLPADMCVVFQDVSKTGCVIAVTWAENCFD